MKFKTLTLSLLLGLAVSPAFAADQYLVRVPANVNLSAAAPETPQEPISLSLSAEALPAGTVGEPYSFNLLDRLTITGGSGSHNYSNTSLSLKDGDALPPGLLLSGSVIAGTPTRQDTHGTSFGVIANYEGSSSTQQYVIPVQAWDPYWSKVTLLLNFEGTPGSTAYSEPVKAPGFLSMFGSAQLSSERKFGNTGLTVIDGHATLPGSLFRFGTRPFTYEMFVKIRPSTPGSFMVLETRPPSTNGPYIAWSIASGGGVTFYVDGSSKIYNGGGAVPNNGQWNHLAYSRDINNIGRLFVNGAMVGSWTDTTNYDAGAEAMIGKNSFNTAQIGGYIDAIRITDGVARYSTNFTVPDQYPQQ